ncbi:MAG: pyrimidine reductase family protein [Acidimicrobiales bacterium]|nr:pyrimidine reductase family protein [Acidimicrobiales bacterium]
MRQLLPAALPEVDPVTTYAGDARPAPEGRPWVLVNMVASTDGATAVEGRSGALGGPVDRAAFTALRAIPDVILVAAGTARAEGYGPPRTPPELQAARQARGQTAKPRIALVTRTLDLDFDGELFSDPASRCLVIAPEDADSERLAAAAGVADVVIAGRGGVDLPAALAHLAAAGTTVVLAEGGPSLLGQLVAADLVDELCLTLSPTLVAGESARIVHGPDLPSGLAPLHLDRVLEQDGTLLLRYLVDRQR